MRHDPAAQIGIGEPSRLGQHRPRNGNVIVVRKANPFNEVGGLGAYPAASVAAESDHAAGKFARNVAASNGQKGEYIVASGPYAEIHVGERTYIIRERMQTLEERLNPERFFRIHRSVIVKLDQIETLLREAGGDYAVQLRCGARLSVSRNRVEPLEKWMGLAKAR